MSNRKKNVGRDPEAQANDSVESRLTEKFLNMSEMDYVRNIVIPVLEAEGYKRIDYNHGPNEIGKDLIFFREESFGRKKLIVAAVKVEKFTKSASSKNGFPGYLTQILQASRNEVMSWDGSRRLPDEILLILADDPSHDILNSNPGLFAECVQRGFQVIHGADVAKSLVTHRRDIAEQLLQSKIDTAKFLASQPTNLPLMYALNIEGSIDIETIFTDLDAAVGDTTIGHAFSLRALGVTQYEIHGSVWSSVKGVVRNTERCFGPVLVKSISEVEHDHANDVKEAATVWADIERDTADARDFSVSIRRGLQPYVSPLKRITREYADELIQDQGKAQLADDFLIFLNGTIGDAGSLIRHGLEVENRAKKLLKKVDPRNDSIELLEKADTLSFQIKAAQSRLRERRLDYSKNEKRLPIPDVAERLEVFVENALKDCGSMVQKCRKLCDRADYVSKLSNYRVSFNSAQLNETLERHIKILAHRFNSSEIANSRNYAKRLLEETKRYLSALRRIRSNSILSSLLQVSDVTSKDSPRLGACILGLLDSGVDVLVTGGAGSGKSTTLEMFAIRCDKRRALDEVVIFLPLAKVVAPPSDENRNPLEHLFSEIARIYKVKLPGITEKYVMEKIDESRQLTIALDGIDEATGLIAWLASVVDELRKRKSELHIVASSRFPVPELSERDFLGIELLPFRPEQVKRFVQDFLRDDASLAAKVTAHLDENPKMFSVVQTPIMNTILCALAKNGVTLPSTKNALYKERFELLWGTYDAKKLVQRIRSRKGCLEDVSKKIAYYLHTHRIRSASRDDVSEYLVEVLGRRYVRGAITLALDELRVPCNVLMEELDGTVGFGHLSYQEYLVSEELYTNRQSEIVSYLTDPWWREALVLIAMKTEDIGSILEDRIRQSGDVGKARATLEAMIEVVSPRQRIQLRELLRGHERLDDFDDF